MLLECSIKDSELLWFLVQFSQKPQHARSKKIVIKSLNKFRTIIELGHYSHTYILHWHNCRTSISSQIWIYIYIHTFLQTPNRNWIINPSFQRALTIPLDQTVRWKQRCSGTYLISPLRSGAWSLEWRGQSWLGFALPFSCLALFRNCFFHRNALQRQPCSLVCMHTLYAC